MINLMSFYYNESFMYKGKDQLSHIQDSIKFHIDHLDKNNWQQNEFIVKTNFSFEYNGIKNLFFDTLSIPNNLFLTKFIAIYEVLLKYPQEIIWFHDIDTFQIKPFDVLEINHLIQNLDILCCNYWPGNQKPQGASMFFNGLNDTIKYIYSLVTDINNLKRNTHAFWPELGIRVYGDEEIIQALEPNSKKISLNLPYSYNRSITRTSASKRVADNPYCLHGNIFQSRFSRRVYSQIISEQNI